MTEEGSMLLKLMLGFQSINIFAYIIFRNKVPFKSAKIFRSACMGGIVFSAIAIMLFMDFMWVLIISSIFAVLTYYLMFVKFKIGMEENIA